MADSLHVLQRRHDLIGQIAEKPPNRPWGLVFGGSVVDVLALAKPAKRALVDTLRDLGDIRLLGRFRMGDARAFAMLFEGAIDSLKSIKSFPSRLSNTQDGMPLQADLRIVRLDI